MALVNESYNFIFIHIFRTGGNSVRLALNNDNYPGGVEMLDVHCDAKDLQSYLFSQNKGAFYVNSFKFAFVRNPFDWMVSTYLYHYHSLAPGYFSIIGEMTFEEFTKWYIEVAMNEKMAPGTNKCITQKQFLTDTDGNLMVDFVARHEDREKGWNRILNRLNISASLPIVNVNTHRVHRNYYPYYTEAARENIAKAFAEDLEMFNYTF